MGLLHEILSRQSTIGNFKEMHDFIFETLAETEAVIDTDEIGNIYVTKGDSATYPTFVCHTDAKNSIRENFYVYRFPKSHAYMAYTEGNDGVRREVCIGADGKCGIYICLKLIQSLPKVKCVFLVNAERCAEGAKNSRKEFFNNSRWIIGLERKGNSEIITTTSSQSLCSLEFKEMLIGVGKNFKYNLSTSTGRHDTYDLVVSQGIPISAANISVGYFKAHLADERISEKDLAKALEFCKHLAEKIIKSYPKIITSIIPITKGRICAVPACSCLTAAAGVLCFSCRNDMETRRKTCTKCNKIQLEYEASFIRGTCTDCNIGSTIH